MPDVRGNKFTPPSSPCIQAYDQPFKWWSCLSKRDKQSHRILCSLHAVISPRRQVAQHRCTPGLAIGDSLLHAHLPDVSQPRGTCPMTLIATTARPRPGCGAIYPALASRSNYSRHIHCHSALQRMDSMSVFVLVSDTLLAVAPRRRLSDQAVVDIQWSHH